MPIPATSCPSRSSGSTPASLRPSDHDVVRPAHHGASGPLTTATASASDERERRQPVGRRPRPQREREQQARRRAASSSRGRGGRGRRSAPRSTPPPPSGSPRTSSWVDSHTSGAGTARPTGRAAAARPGRLSTRPALPHYNSPRMFSQPKRGQARLTLRDRVRDELRYAALSDVVLAVRAKDGDGRALEALVRASRRGRAAARRVPARPTRRMPRMPPRRRLQSSVPASTSSAAGAGSRPGSTAWSPTPAAISASASAGAGTSRSRWWPSGPRPRAVPHDLALQREQRRVLALRMADLSDDQRQVMVMKDVLSLSYEEIARGAGDAGGHGQVPRPPRPGAHAPGDGAAARGGLGVTPGFAPPLDRAAIEAIIPHRDPFLLVDEIIELEPGVARRAAATTCATRPGTCGATSRAARSCRACCRSRRWHRWARSAGSRTRTSPAGWRCSRSIDDARFKRIVVPGDMLDLRCRITRLRGPIGKADAEASVDGELACRAALTFALTELDGVIAACSRASRVLGIGSHVPDRVMTERRARRRMVDDQRRVDRAAHRHPRAADRRRPASRRPRWAPQAAEAALADAGVDAGEIDLIVARDRQPRLLLPGHRLADRRADRRRRRGRLRPVGRLHGLRLRARRRPTARSPPGWPTRCWWSARRCSPRLLDWSDRSTCVLFGDGAGAVVLRRDDAAAGLLRLRDGRGRQRRAACCRWPLPATRSTDPEGPLRADERSGGLQVRHPGRGRVGASAAWRPPAWRWPTSTCSCRTRPTSGSSTTRRGGWASPERRCSCNVAQYGNTSAASIPIGLDEAYGGAASRRATSC